jgi:hypothetical protein
LGERDISTRRFVDSLAFEIRIADLGILPLRFSKKIENHEAAIPLH